MKRIYIAGTLNGMAVEYMQNIHKMMQEAEKVRKRGHAVFIPCLDFSMGIMFGNWEYNDFFNNSQPWLKVSDFVYVCPHSTNSHGTQAEIKRAKELGIPVIYDIKDLP